MDAGAAAAVFQAATSALGVGSMPSIPLNVAEGFAAGALLCGACLLPVIAPRRIRARSTQPESRQPDARRPAASPRKMTGRHAAPAARAGMHARRPGRRLMRARPTPDRD